MTELIPVDLEEVRKYWWSVEMVKQAGIKIPGFKLDKAGKLLRDPKLYDLCTQLRKKQSKKITVKKPVGR